MTSKFKKGQSTFTCSSCKKLTRNTGDNGACGTCPDCYNLSGIDNFLSDNGAVPMFDDYGDEVHNTLQRRPELKSCFPEIVKAMHEAKVTKFGPENTWADRHDV